MDGRGSAVVGDQRVAVRLRQAGLRATQPRLLVLSALERMGGHRSADELISTLEAEGTALPRQSVYNVLDSLVTAGLAQLADAGPGRALFEAASTWHHHFVCRRCGLVKDIPCVVGAKPCLDAGLANAVVDEAQVIFRGLCPDCAPGKSLLA